jgi:heterodisulfide reductase subunit A
MYTAKHAMLYKHRVPDGQAYVFYIDIRAGGKGYEEFVRRAMEEDQVLYLRGKVSKIFQDDDKVVVWGTDTLSGLPLEVAADLVVLATATVPRDGARELGQMLGIEADECGFYTEADGNMRPLETVRPGIFVAGADSGPKDIPEAVAQGSGAAAKVLSLFARWSSL